MTRITEYFMKRPMLFWSFVTAIIIAGILSFIQMPKLEDPAVSAKQAMVIVPYPGASAHEVELKVALMMEDELRALPNVNKIKTSQRKQDKDRMPERNGYVYRRIPDDSSYKRPGTALRPDAPQGK